MVEINVWKRNRKCIRFNQKRAKQRILKKKIRLLVKPKSTNKNKSMPNVHLYSFVHLPLPA